MQQRAGPNRSFQVELGRRLHGITMTASASTICFKKRDNLGPLLGGVEAVIGFHIVAGDHLIWICDKAVERRFVPHQIGVFHCT